jgi:hypothetical protein
LSKNCPDNKSVAKGIPTNSTPEEELPVRGINHNWHWLFKHPVEFSKNNHTPPGNPPKRTPDPGHFRSVVTAALAPGTFTTLPHRLPRVNRCVPVCHASYGSAPATRAAANRSLDRRIWQDGRYGLPYARPFPCPIVNLTRSVPPRQIRLAASSGHRPVPGSEEYNPRCRELIPALRPPGLSPCFVRSALAERKLRVCGFDRQIRG